MNNRRRMDYLPILQTDDDDDMKNYQYYTIGSGFRLTEQDAEEMSKRLKLHVSVITYNADKLDGICQHLLTFLREKDVASAEPVLNPKQMAIALEFFLHMDGKYSSNEKDEPKTSFEMIPCGQFYCPCCYPQAPWKTQENQIESIVDFNTSSSKHTFLNGYTTYLNAPATCQTTNIIYSMTCPCGHFDYVDSTDLTLCDAMTEHRKHGNRIIHTFLTGSSLFPSIPLGDQIERQIEKMNQIRLYQHSKRCPAALRLFLDYNPKYWCFIPMLRAEAHIEDRDPASSYQSSTTFSARHRRILTECLARVPLPFTRYAFSFKQRQRQRQFFEELLLSNVDELPYLPVDLYRMTTIAVLPSDQSSIILRYILETLFSIHGETKLNMICPMGTDPEQYYGRPYLETVWCAKLKDPSSLISAK